MSKWNDELKKINNAFDTEFDENLKNLMSVEEQIKNNNQSRYDYCKERLTYIGKHNEEEIEEILKENCLPLLERNTTEAEKELKKSTDYVESLDERENDVLTELATYITKLGSLNDDFVSKFGTVNQKYEIEKAKILDEDEELV